jgi:glycosyltransferase involved in cell wall biosynthesis
MESKNQESSNVLTYNIEQFRPKKYNIALVIPVINEGARIVNQLKELEKIDLKVDVIIADGGSDDESVEYFKSKSEILTTLLTKTSSGKLSAQIRMAFHYCLSNDYEAVITMDGNNKDGVEGILVIQAALEKGFDFVQGSRFVRGGTSKNTPLKRLLAIRLVHAPLTSLGARFWFTDSTNGFRGHSMRLISSKELDLFREIFSDYELVSYIPVAAGRHKMKICEVPVRRDYPNKGSIPTKIHGLGNEMRLLLVLIRVVRGLFNPN